MGAPSSIKIWANTIPTSFRAQIEAAVKRALSDRSGDWRASLYAPQNASYWQVKVDGPGTFEWSGKFDGPGEQNADYIEQTVRRAIGDQLPSFSTITQKLEQKWTEPDECPVCGSREWNVTEIPYSLTEMGGSKAIPIYPITCTNCGLTYLFNGIIAGLFSGKSD